MKTAICLVLAILAVSFFNGTAFAKTRAQINESGKVRMTNTPDSWRFLTTVEKTALKQARKNPGEKIGVGRAVNTWKRVDFFHYARSSKYDRTVLIDKVTHRARFFEEKTITQGRKILAWDVVLLLVGIIATFYSFYYVHDVRKYVGSVVAFFVAFIALFICAQRGVNATVALVFVVDVISIFPFVYNPFGFLPVEENKEEESKKDIAVACRVGYVIYVVFASIALIV